MRKFLFLLIVMLLAFGTAAQAAYVTEWDYSLSGIFINSQLTNGDSLPDGTTLSWGIPAFPNVNQSSLVIDPSAVTSQVQTFVGGGEIPNTFWAESIDLTHNNFPIFEPALDFTTLQVTVLLTPFAPPGPSLPTQEFTFGIDFEETLNVGDFQNDVFALLDGFPNFNFFYNTATQEFSPVAAPGFDEYFVNVFPSTGGVLDVLDAEYAALVGVPVGTIGFTTQEDLSTTLGFSFTISTQPLVNPIPEPSTIIMLCCGLIGLFAFSRHNLQKR